MSSVAYLTGQFGSGLAPGAIPAPAPVNGHAVLRYTHILQRGVEMIPITPVRLPIIDGVLCSVDGVPSTEEPIEVQATDDPLLAQTGVLAQVDLIFEGGSSAVQVFLQLPTDQTVSIATAASAGAPGAVYVAGLTQEQLAALDEVSGLARDAADSASVAVDTANSIAAGVTSQVNGLVPPLVTERLSSDATIRDAAVAAMSDAGVIAEVTWSRGSLPSGTDLNTVVTPGAYSAANNTLNRPAAVIGTLEVLRLADIVTQRYMTWETKPRTFSRTFAIDGTPRAWVNTAWDRGGIVAGADVNSILTPGIYDIQNGAVANLPVAAVGSLQVVATQNSVIQTYTTWGATPRVFVRALSTTASFWPWVESASVEALAAGLVHASIERGRATKTVPLAFTAPGSPLPEDRPVGAARWVRRFAVAPTRVRVHIANRNVGSSMAGTDVPLTGLYVGAASADGQMVEPTALATSGTIPGGAAEYVSRWVDIDATDGAYIGISIAWSAPGGPATVQHAQGGGWVTSDDSLVGDDMLSADWTRSQTTPFHVWLEAEVPATTPVILAHGDSISIGTATSDPVGDSYLAAYCLAQGALPVLLAQHGSAMSNWADGSARWAAYYPGIPLPSIIDAVITTLGQNDLAPGIALETMKTRHAAVVAALTARFSRVPIYFGTLTGSGKAAEVQAVRHSYNSWLKTLPLGARGAFDFAAAVDAPGEDALAPSYSADGLHPNAAGQGVMGQAVLAHPPTPFTATPSQIRSIVNV